MKAVIRTSSRFGQHLRAFARGRTLLQPSLRRPESVS